MKKLVTKSFVAALTTAVLFASITYGAVCAHETLRSEKGLSTVGSSAVTITWDLPWGLDADPAAVNIWTYPDQGVEVTLADVEATMPNGLLIWCYGGSGVGWRFYKKGWGAVNTLEKLIPGKGHISIVPTAGVWEIPQEPTPVDGIVIETLLVTADHCYLRTESWGYKVGQGQNYHIECIVSDTSGGVSYEWSCTLGYISEVSQDGSIITWIAPDTTTRATITVIVSDGIGNIVSESVLLYVVTCSKCEFGC